jgi:ABC transport system ATP-binding/permease protein
MSERILRALMQLFAIIAQVDENNDASEENQVVKSSKAIRIIESFLRVEISAQLIGKYIELFNEHLNTLHQKQSKKDGEKKRTSVNSVKVLRICSQINEELTQKQKVIVLIRIIEFIQSNDNVSEQEVEFVNTVADAFNIDKEEYDLVTDFILSSSINRIKNDDVLYICPRPDESESNCVLLEGLDDEIRILFVKSVNLIFFRYFGKDELSINGQFIPNDRTHIFTQGATLRTQKSKSLYFSDVVLHFLKFKTRNKLSFRTEGLSYKFRSGQAGLQPMDFEEESGKLVGIMGGSGTGKSTFINILNGNLEPTSGRVLINGLDVHKEKVKLQGIIGFVSQDDLLIEELTVYQNLYFNAKLCFGNLRERDLKRKVIDMLYAIGLYEVRDLVVGSPMLKTISGGQRKRLNIALELIREPEVLFVDEPTSGLSSRDSENIMDLLKEMTFKGKLIFVVIHQPSSDIFKQFDRLFIIDRGGYPVFDGNPIDAVVYFKNHIHHGNADERECAVCGNVNPEQIFNILDSKIVDEYGNLTAHRKTTPEEWYQKYNELKIKPEIEEIKTLPKGQSVIADKLKQFRVFFLRDLLAKLSNRQYILVTLLEAPVLAVVLAFVVKFFNGEKDASGNPTYSFYLNENIPQYIFIAVVVSLFLGLTVAAEEIYKDKHILKRESFLNLSKGSYLLSKISILFLISGIQSLLFVLVGNLILEISGMLFEYWIVLFTTSCVANVMGLNISSAFSTAKVIYIIVPILIIPQLLFSGVIVKFDRLHPSFSKQTEVPLIGNLMPSRWAYEAISVTQAKDNWIDNQFFDLQRDKSYNGWKKDYWHSELKNQLDILETPGSSKATVLKAKEIISNEIQKEEDLWDNFKCKDCIEQLNAKIEGEALIGRLAIVQYIDVLKLQYTKNYNEQNEKIEKLKRSIGERKYNQFKDQFSNEALNDQVTNRREAEKFVVEDGRIKRKDTPIFNVDKSLGLFEAPFYAPYKFIAGNKMSTFWANILILWFFVIAMWIALYTDLLRRSIEMANYLRERYLKFN